MESVMSKRYIVAMIALILMGIGSLFAQENTYPQLQIQPEEVQLGVGDSLQLHVFYVDSNEIVTDTTATWSVIPDSLGSFSSSGYFYARAEGQGYIYASLGDLTDSITVEIESDDGGHHHGSFPRLVIVPQQFEISIGDSLQLHAFYMTSMMSMTDTVVSGWSLTPDSIGTLTNEGWFFAKAAGEGTITAQLDTLQASAEVSVEGEGSGHENWDTSQHVLVLPSDTVAEVGSTIHFQVQFILNQDSLVDTTAQWSMRGMPVGSLNDSGDLTLSSAGYALIDAQVGDYTGSALVVATDSTADTTGVRNNITITRDSHNPQGYSVMKQIKEGELWKIGGLPHPMNVLNGGGIYFPYGSLSEDIRINVSLPGFAHDNGDSVTYGPHGVVAGVDFQVMVDDTVSEPYYFNTPLIVGLPFKRGLLRHLGIDPTTLGLYFTTMQGDTVSFDSTGIQYTTVDSSWNMIFSSVAHFSSLAVRGNPTTTKTDQPENRIPSGYVLSQNYPNPFNPVTQIQYVIPKQSHVRITVYNMLGQQVKTLVNSDQPAGSYHVLWDGTNQQDLPVASGMYFYRLETAHFNQMKKMVLLR